MDGSIVKTFLQWDRPRVHMSFSQAYSPIGCPGVWLPVLHFQQNPTPRDITSSPRRAHETNDWGTFSKKPPVLASDNLDYDSSNNCVAIACAGGFPNGRFSEKELC